jgi:hypothetical protein
MSWILLVVLYTGEIKQESYNTSEQCEIALLKQIDNGSRKHIKLIECILEE